MRKSSGVAVGLAAAGLVAVLATSGGARAQDGPPKQIRIAVVNVNEFMNKDKYEHAKEFTTQWEAMKKEINNDLTLIRKKADELKSQVANLIKGSELWMKLAEEWNLEETKLKLRSEVGKQRLETMRDNFRTDLYAEARKVATEVAKELKYDLVLRADEGEFEEDRNDTVTIQRNLLRAVLYYEPSMDITDKVIARLNEDFKKKKKK